MSKNIATFIDMPKPPKVDKLANGNFIVNFEEQLAATRRKQINEFTIRQLYAAYKDTPVSKLLVIDMVEFEEFLKRYLPIYLKEKEQ